jgi:methylmalonyl-CoA mutase N-terminal domain/subunit
MGGAVAATKQGWFQRRLSEGAYRDQCAIERGESIVVGVNAFKVEEPDHPSVFKHDPTVGERQIAKLQALRRKRDNPRVQNTLAALRKVCASSDNVMPAVLDCVKAFATIGEIGDVWREAFGEYTPETMRF